MEQKTGVILPDFSSRIPTVFTSMDINMSGQIRRKFLGRSDGMRPAISKVVDLEFCSSLPIEEA